MKKAVSIVLVLIIILSCLMLMSCEFTIGENDEYKVSFFEYAYHKFGYLILKDVTIGSTPLDVYFDPKMLNNRLWVFVDKALFPVDESFFGDGMVSEIIDIHGGGIENTFGYRVVLNTESKLELLCAAYKISKIPGVKFIHPDYHFAVWESTSNDPYYTNEQLWGLDRIEVEKVWRFSTGLSAVTVGIIDSGVYAHDDLGTNLSTGYDFVSNDTNAYDDIDGHGTHIAGIIGGVGNNSLGIVGVNWNVSLVPLQIYDQYSNVSIQDWIEAINDFSRSHNTNSPISILNMSLGTTTDELIGIASALSEYQGLIICSAGNGNINTDTFSHYPSYYGMNIPENTNYIANMIVVGAIDMNDNRSDWRDPSIPYYHGASNFGTQSVDIYAPGTNIYSTYLDNQYIAKNGTSMAAPYVSGVAALLLSINPSLTAIELKDCILGGADEIEITVADASTQKVRRLNAWGAFKYMLDNYVPSYTLSSSPLEISVNTNRQSLYYLEKKPIVEINIPYSEEFTFTVEGVGSQVDVVLYDSEMNEIEIEKSWRNNLWTVTFTEELEKGTYYISSTYSLASGNIAFDITVSHNHHYDCWAKHTQTHHVEACACGVTGYATSLHVVKSGTAIGNKGLCMYCGALINLGDDFVLTPTLQVPKITANGSYILPSGIVVLVDEDIEAYLNGTLVFYDNDDVPVTE